MPQLEKYKKDGVDVLYFDKDIDEFAAMMHDYDKHEFINIASDLKDAQPRGARQVSGLNHR